MEQLTFFKINKPERILNAVHKENIVVDNIEEINTDGIQQQKRDISKFLVENNIPKSYTRQVHMKNDYIYGNKKMYNTFYYDGFYIEGYKIKYTHDNIYCYWEYRLDDTACTKYITAKLKELYMLLKDKFDVVPVVTHMGNLIDKNKGYNKISYLEITKNKELLNKELELVNELENKLTDYICEFRYEEE